MSLDRIKAYSEGKIELSEYEKRKYDYNNDGQVDELDFHFAEKNLNKLEDNKKIYIRLYNDIVELINLLNHAIKILEKTFNSLRNSYTIDGETIDNNEILKIIDNLANAKKNFQNVIIVNIKNKIQGIDKNIKGME